MRLALHMLAGVDDTRQTLADGDVLTYSGALDAWVPAALPPSGGGGGTGNDRRWNVGSSETSIDEFDDDALAAAWARVDGTGAAAGNCDWSEGADVLTAKRLAANTGNAMNAIVRPIGTVPATGDAWVTCLTLHGPPSTNYMVGGLVIADGNTHGAGKQVCAEVLTDNTGIVQKGQIVAFTNYGTAGTAVTVANTPHGAPTYLRVVYKGSSQWRLDTSPNGVQWLTGASLLTVASFTPSHVGLYQRDGATGTKAIASFEFLRRVSGVT